MIFKASRLATLPAPAAPYPTCCREGKQGGVPQGAAGANQWANQGSATRTKHHAP